MMDPLEHTSDVVVIGSGVAGLSFALAVAEQAQVTLVTKRELSNSNGTITPPPPPKTWMCSPPR